MMLATAHLCMEPGDTSTGLWRTMSSTSAVPALGRHGAFGSKSALLHRVWDTLR
jgi:hypothetical protein